MLYQFVESLHTVCSPQFQIPQIGKYWLWGDILGLEGSYSLIDQGAQIFPLGLC